MAQTYVIELTPLPMWADKTETERRALWVRLLADALVKYPPPNTWPAMGPERVLSQDPHEPVKHPKRSPAPAVHTTDPALRTLWNAGKAAFLEMWARAAAKVAEGLAAEFPTEGCSPPWFLLADEEVAAACPG